MRKLFAVVLLTLTASAIGTSANEVSYRSLQSGTVTGPTPLHDRGIRGEGQIIAVLDTGVDYASCYFAEADNSAPPFNTGTPGGGLQWENVDGSRRKVIAYNFLYSCDQYPGAVGCDTPDNAMSLDNQGHGTHAAATAVGDRGAPGAHDYADAIAPAAKLVVQDAGFIGGDSCSHRPGIGCPVNVTPILEQAWLQGARIHSNSWGDLQGRPSNPPTANYPQSARDVDAFVWTHPDMLIVFNTGNLGVRTGTPRSSLSAPGSAKNTLQIGGARSGQYGDDVVSRFTLFGPTRDGRIKPDLVGPARVLAGDINRDGNASTCDITSQEGTSWASPSIAGAAALVRQYFTDGFYPTGTRKAGDALAPSAALLKATLIAGARPLRWRHDIVLNDLVDAFPVPSHEQGWGFPVLDDALYFDGEVRRTRVVDVPSSKGLAAGLSATIRVSARTGTPLKAVLVWTDPPGVAGGAIDPTPQLVNDLDLRVTTAGATYFGNGAAPDRRNNVEVVSVAAPAAGTYEITVSAQSLGVGPRQNYALVITGDFDSLPTRMRAVRH